MKISTPPSTYVDASMKTDSEHMTERFGEDWIKHLERDDLVSLGLFLSFQLPSHLNLGETKAAELASARAQPASTVPQKRDLTADFIVRFTGGKGSLLPIVGEIKSKGHETGVSQIHATSVGLFENRHRCMLLVLANKERALLYILYKESVSESPCLRLLEVYNGGRKEFSMSSSEDLFSLKTGRSGVSEPWPSPPKSHWWDYV